MNPSLGAAIRYGLPGFALAFAALPLYLLTPALYAEGLGLNLAAVGLVLMATRLTDAVADPWIGRLIDRAQSGYRIWLAGGLLVLAVSLALLVNPPIEWLTREGSSSLAGLLWMGLFALLVSLANSTAMLAHQGWAVAWTAEQQGQARLVGARETWALLGVILAAAFAAQREGFLMAVVLVMAVAASILGTRNLFDRTQTQKDEALLPWRSLLNVAPFRRLLVIYSANALANSVPATLVLFFMQDVLGLAPELGAGLLALYFVCAAIGVPLWTKVCTKFGAAKSWRIAMLAAIGAFAWALTLERGDALAFAIICVVTGLTLGAELIVPPLLLGRVIHAAGHRQKLEASYFGVLNLAQKLALAAAAGLTLPALFWLGYAPGQATGMQDSQPAALQWVYAGLPCGLKLIAISMLYRYERKGVIQ